MNKVVAPTKSTLKKLISLSQFGKFDYSKNDPILTVQITKQPSTLFKNSLWIGHRNGGMSSWLSTILPHLPYRRFCLFMDQDSYQNSEHMYEYYSQYFSKLFHKQFVGTVIHPRRLICPTELKNINQVKVADLQNQLIHSCPYKSPSVILDLRGSETAVKCETSKLIKNYKNAQYINLPLNEQDLIDQLENKTKHLPTNTKFITVCAQGYRSLIGYSLLNLIKKPKWEIKLCRSPIKQIKNQLCKPIVKPVDVQSNILQQRQNVRRQSYAALAYD